MATKRFKEGTILRGLRQKGGYIYYFDEHGIYSRIKIEDYYDSELELSDLTITNRRLGPPYHANTYGLRTVYANLIRDFYGVTYGCANKALSKLRLGDSVGLFEFFIRRPHLIDGDLPEGIDRFITKISNPEIIREQDNLNKKNSSLPVRRVRKNYLSSKMSSMRLYFLEKVALESLRKFTGT